MTETLRTLPRGRRVAPMSAAIRVVRAYAPLFLAALAFLALMWFVPAMTRTVPASPPPATPAPGNTGGGP